MSASTGQGGRAMRHVQSIGALNAKAIASVLVIALAPVVAVHGAMRFSGLLGSTDASLVAVFVAAVLSLLLLSPLILVRVKVAGHVLTAGDAVHTLRVPVAELCVDRARVHRNFDPKDAVLRRIDGTHLPGLSLGWFERPCGQLVFVAVGEWKRVVVIPAGLYDVIVSPVDPRAFIDALRGARD